MVKHHDNRWQHHKAICQGSILKHCCGALTVEHKKKKDYNSKTHYQHGVNIFLYSEGYNERYTALISSA